MENILLNRPVVSKLESSAIGSNLLKFILAVMALLLAFLTSMGYNLYSSNKFLQQELLLVQQNEATSNKNLTSEINHLLTIVENQNKTAELIARELKQNSSGNYNYSQLNTSIAGFNPANNAQPQNILPSNLPKKTNNSVNQPKTDVPNNNAFAGKLNESQDKNNAFSPLKNQTDNISDPAISMFTSTAKPSSGSLSGNPPVDSLARKNKTTIPTIKMHNNYPNYYVISTSKYKIGAELGLTQNGFYGTNYTGNSTTGILVGALINYDVKKNLSVQGGIRYITKGDNISSNTAAQTSENSSNTITMNYMELPLDLVKKFSNSGKFQFIAGGGPNVSYLLSLRNLNNASNASTNSLVSDKSPNPTDPSQISIGSTRKLDFGLHGFVGCQSTSGFFAKVGFEAGFRTVFQNSSDSHNYSFLLSAGYLVHRYKLGAIPEKNIL